MSCEPTQNEIQPAKTMGFGRQNDPVGPEHVHWAKAELRDSIVLAKKQRKHSIKG